VVDDEPSIVDAVATSLRYEGFTVDEATTGRRALAQAQDDPPDLVILDVMLPDLDGLEVTRRLRSDGLRVPVLFLTARDTLQDKLAGLTIGGDDYVTKPFALAELIARVHAILRRTGYEPEDDGMLRFADLELDENAHEVRRGGQRHPAHGHRVQPPALLLAQPASRALQVADPRPRVALRLRRRRQRGGDLRELPAQEVGAPRAAAHPHHPARRLHPPRG
jgi:DNA-binding response OmpR family regulator